ncbi:hypothetical protein DERP_014869, partial [Dermatophagoides pteronyssinus]
LNIRASSSSSSLNLRLSLIRSLLLLLIIIMNLILPIRINNLGNETRKSSLINNSSTILSETFESIIQELLLSKSSTIKSSKTKSISSKERNRLIRMVDKIVQLANEILDLNYTKINKNNKINNKINDNSTHTNNEKMIVKNLAQIIPIDLFHPCQSTDIDLIHSNNINHQMDHSNELIENMDNDDDYNIDNRFQLGRRRRRYQIGFDILQEIIERSNHLKGIVTDMIRKNLVKDCLQLKLPNIFRIPDPPYDNISKSMILIYQTLANQTAHLYSLWNQHKQHSLNNDNCLLFRHHIETITIKQQQQQQRQQQSDKISDPRDNDDDQPQRSMIPKMKLLRQNNLLIEENFFHVSNNLRSLLCYLNQAIILFRIPVPIEPIIQQIISQPIDSIERQHLSCARKSIFECQLMRDSVRLFNDLEQFFRNESHRFFSS